MEYNLRLTNNIKIIYISISGLIFYILSLVFSIMIFKPDKLELLFMIGIMLTLSILTFILSFKMSDYNCLIKVSDNLFQINEVKFLASDIKSYNFESSGMFNAFLLRLKNGKKIHLVIRLKSNQINDYNTFMNYLTNEIDKFNNDTIDSNSKILLKNIYNSRFSKLFGFVLLFILALFHVWIFGHDNIKTITIFKIMGLDLLSSSYLIRVFILKK
jgi:hypothetical protein